MKKRLMIALAAGALVAAMLPGVASAGPEGVHFEKSLIQGCAEEAIPRVDDIPVLMEHWTPEVNPSVVNEGLRDYRNAYPDDCQPPRVNYLDAGNGDLFSGRNPRNCQGVPEGNDHPMCRR
jgi:hypothetical protein